MKPKQKTILPLSFEATPTALEAVGPPFVGLEKQALKIALPDLRNTLMYYGSNIRPDVSERASVVQVGVRGVTFPTPVSANVPVYLKYEGRMSSVKWSFSEKNSPTSTWLEIKPKENGADVKVFMQDCENQPITEPVEFASFSLTQMHMPFNAQAGNTFEIGGFRADTSLLIRQKAVWFGQDLFLQQYGGEKYQFAFEKERIDFLNPDNRYSCYVGVGDCLVFFADRWREVTPGEDSIGKPLLVTRKIDERSISFDLWDPSGKIRISLDLHKAPSIPTFAQRLNIKLVGARSKKDWIAEIGGTRMFLRADDWLLLKENSWQKFSNAKDLDDYVTGQVRGIMLALEGTEKVGNDVGLVGVLFDESRTQQIPMRITLFKSWEQSASKSDAEDEDDDDDDEDDDDDDEIDMNDEDDEPEDEDDDDDEI